MTLSGWHIVPFSLRHAHLFSRLRISIDKESEHLLAKKDERKENAVHVILKLLVSQRRMVTFLAFDGAFDIGYVSLVFPKFAKLRGNAYLTIAVREKYRGKGVGSMLMEKAESYAKEKGVRRMELEVFGKNEKAIELYKKRNYEIEGVKKGAVETSDGFDDIVIMAKKLQ
jgi:ribosomal protein S18 acetylase RimI-like enzyme